VAQKPAEGNMLRSWVIGHGMRYFGNGDMFLIVFGGFGLSFDFFQFRKQMGGRLLFNRFFDQKVCT
jgi:hypothetical protein